MPGFVGVDTSGMMPDFVGQNRVPGMPGKKETVVHLVAEKPRAMVIFPLQRNWAVKIVDQNPTRILQYAIRLACDTKQILPVAKIETKTKDNEVEGAVFELEFFCRALDRVDAAPAGQLNRSC